ncbi:25S rRNA adenine-N(1) methyltransferase [Ceratocystis fimbriata CBS 114723]|uniref:25S rRNA adenine-N(1) methyltransferase n=1 Tax=Ceratocystis fimbriata CBS 114723 TaxID=1035309 RepID=A0A2C5WUG8_9PEZI|nr:25S rRNA adenine-N(1) methyltransferase [Ceratocystis fimbriata CBS 114723]
MAKSKKVRLSAGRPPVLKPLTASITRKASRTVINRHHQLEKARTLAAKQGDKAKAAEIAAEIEALGGLDQYQKASLQGQRKDRGGDSSVVLLEWLGLNKKANKLQETPRLRMLEVGALSTKNACSLSGCFDMVCIDLNSQEPGITQQDFMERPLPSSNADRFDVLSLSLVVNFVPDAAVRGNMLRRVLSFLRQPSIDYEASLKGMLPALFLVLPRSCVDNSRYFTSERLAEIMTSLGFSVLREKKTNKLIYQLWQRTSLVSCPNAVFLKQELNPGVTRNNFSIVLNKPRNT